MAFDANRDMRIEATETSDDHYQLRTQGLAKQKRPELEIIGVPTPALHAAAGVLNMIAEYTVSTAEIRAGQTVGNVLTVGQDGAKRLLLVRASVVVAPARGFFAALKGGNKGVLRLNDVDGDEPKDGESSARTALATMLVHRAETRLAKDDQEGARKELEAAIETFAGEVGKSAPNLEGLEGDYNWQNHLAYRVMAELKDASEDAKAWIAKADARHSPA